MAGRVALEHRRQVGARRRPDLGIGNNGFVDEGTHGQLAQFLAAQLSREVIGKSLLKPLMLQDGIVDETRHRRLAEGNALSLLAQLRPYRIAGGDIFKRGSHGTSFQGVLLPQKPVKLQNTRHTREFPPDRRRGNRNADLQGPGSAGWIFPGPSGPAPRRFRCMADPSLQQNSTKAHTMSRYKELHVPPFNQVAGGMLDLLLTRRSGSAKTMAGPGPTPGQLADILKCGARVPDHGKLFPWRFMVFEGDARARAGDILAEVTRAEGAHERQVEEERGRFLRAPVVIAVISTAREMIKIPVWEQQLSAGAACQRS